MERVELIATATFGLEAVVADEVRELGYEVTSLENGKVTYSAPPEGICRSNLWLRTADRVRLKVGEFTARSFEELFQGTLALPWPELLPAEAEFPVEGKSIKSALFSVPDCQAIVKKAVVEKMKKQYKKQWFEEKGPLFRIEVALLKDVATLTLDTSGAGLHKRGYREHTGHAPLRENLAAALVLLSRWRPGTLLVDPFCGSGTIPIEAALIGLDRAPGLQRSFSAETWPLIPRSLWERAREEAQDRARRTEPLEIRGTDLEQGSINRSRRNARLSGVDGAIHFQVQPLPELRSRKHYGKIICNPPYGERLGTAAEVDEIYRMMGIVFRRLETWSYYILTANPHLEKHFGRRATKRRKLYNGNIKVNFYQYFGPKPPRPAAAGGEGAAKVEPAQRQHHPGRG